MPVRAWRWLTGVCNAVQECMRVAQALYEAGWITYMRTDNPILSQAAKGKARECVEQLYGADTLGSETRAIKKPKGSQEAHEPIRPALTDDPAAPGGFNLKPPLQGMQLRLYDLILQRTLASVMTDALIDLTSVHVSARGPGEAPMGPPLAGFRASGMVVRSPGWMRAYQEGSDGSAGGAERGAGGMRIASRVSSPLSARVPRLLGRLPPACLPSPPASPRLFDSDS